MSSRNGINLHDKNWKMEKECLMEQMRQSQASGDDERSLQIGEELALCHFGLPSAQTMEISDLFTEWPEQ